MSASRNHRTADRPCRSLGRLELLDALSVAAGVTPRPRTLRSTLSTGISLGSSNPTS